MLRPLFRSVARTHSVELFVAACLLVVIVVGLATAAAGLSMALGALIGGLLLAGTEYCRQVEVTIEPFKGLAVGVFLISVGMSLDIRTLGTWPFLVSTAIACVVLLKLLVVTGLARAFGLNCAQSLHAGLLLGPGGEFAFVIVSVASGEHLLASDTAQVLLFVTALTMATIPLLSGLGAGLVPRLAPKMPVDPSILVPQVSDALPRVIVQASAGSGRPSRHCWRCTRCPMLRSTSMPIEWRASESRERPCISVVERQHGLLLGRLDCREPHRRAAHCFANRFRIESIALATLHIRLDVPGRHKPYLVPEPDQFSGPVMRCRTRLNANQARWQRSKKPQDVGSP